MKAKLLKEQMGVPVGTEMEVLETGRAWTLKAPSGAEIVVAAWDVEMVPDTEPFSEPAEPSSALDYADAGLQPKPEVDPKDPSLLVNIFGSQPQPVESEGPIDPETDPLGGHPAPIEQTKPEAEPQTEQVHEFGSEPAADFDRTLADDDLDEPLPEKQDPCEGESCESCQ